MGRGPNLAVPETQIREETLVPGITKKPAKVQKIKLELIKLENRPDFRT